MKYDLTDLRLFAAIADTGSVSRGAAACFLAPSSASLRIKQLEDTLGVTLLLRQARGVSLTPAGKVMLEHCRRCLAGLQQMHSDLAPYAQGVRAQVTLLANSSAVASFLPGDLQSFLIAYPEVRIAMHERLSHQIIEAVAQGSADLGVVTWPHEHPSLAFHPYREDALLIIAPADFPLAAQERLRFLQCMDYPFVSLQTGSAIHTFLMNKAAALGRTLDLRIQVSSFGSVVAMVAAGAGISLIPRSALRDVDRSNVRALALDEDWAPRSLSICVRRHDELRSPYVDRLLAQLTSANCRPGPDQASE